MSFALGQHKYSFRCRDFDVLYANGAIRTVHLTLSDARTRVPLFSATIPGAINTLSPGPWLEDFRALYESVAAVTAARRLRDPYGLDAFETLDSPDEDRT